MSRLKVLKILLVCFVFSAGQVVASELSELKKKNKDLKAAVEQAESKKDGLKVKLQALEQAYDSRKAQVETYEKLSVQVETNHQKLKALEYSIRKKQAVLKYYDKNFVPRLLDPGASFPVLKSGSTTYSKVSIEKVLRDSIKIKHTSGFSTLHSRDLPEDIRNRFVFRPKVKDLTRMPDGLWIYRPWISKRAFKTSN